MTDGPPRAGTEPVSDAGGDDVAPGDHVDAPDAADVDAPVGGGADVPVEGGAAAVPVGGEETSTRPAPEEGPDLSSLAPVGGPSAGDPLSTEEAPAPSILDTVPELARPGRRIDRALVEARHEGHPWVRTGPEGLVGGGLVTRLRTSAPLLRNWIGREFSARYRQSVLDVLWSLVQPVAVLLIYGAVLTGAFGVTGDGLPYLSFAWAGLAPWTFMSNALAMCVLCISFEGSISKTYFPREVIPLAVIGAAFVDLAIQTVILVVLAVFQGVRPDYHIVGLVLVDLVLILWTSAIGVFIAALAVFIRDVRHITALVLRLGFFASPIMYPITQYPESVSWVVDVNPVAVFAESTRDVVLRDTWPDWTVLGIHGAIAASLLVLALMYIRSVEPRMVDLV